jgi:hypothetical protein
VNLNNSENHINLVIWQRILNGEDDGWDMSLQWAKQGCVRECFKEPEGRRKTGQARLRWMEPVENYLVGNRKEKLEGRTRVMEENERLF